MKDKISIIIPVFNEEKMIGRCLQSLLDQSSENFELILVDDGSTDQTGGIIKEIKEKDNRISLYHQDHQGPGTGRNLGAKYAKGKILVFVDADMTFDRKFIEILTEPISLGQVKGTFSKDEYVDNWDNVWARSWNINEGWEKKRRHPINYPDKQKVFRAILKSEFDRVGGFNPGGYTDDYSLSEKLGYEAVAVRGAIFYHANPDNLSEVYKQAKWAAKRRYKLGYLGFLVAILRASLPWSLITGLFKSVSTGEYSFVIFKVVYNTGITIGIFEYLFTGKSSK